MYVTDVTWQVMNTTFTTDESFVIIVYCHLVYEKGEERRLVRTLF